MCLSQYDSAFYNGNDTRDRTNMSPVAALIGEIKRLLEGDREFNFFSFAISCDQNVFASNRFAQLGGVLPLVSDACQAASLFSTWCTNVGGA